MGPQLTHACAAFRDREDGPTTVEYAVIMALAVAGLCIAAFTSRGTNATGPRADGFTLTLRNESRSPPAKSNQLKAGTAGLTAAEGQNGREAKAANESGMAGGGRLANGSVGGKVVGKNSAAAAARGADLASGDTATAAGGNGAESKTDKTVPSMSEEDARRAIIGLLKAYPKTFAVSTEAIAAAPVVREKDHVKIASFYCYLRSNEFVYRPAPGQTMGGVFGVFYQNDRGEWTGRITQIVR